MIETLKLALAALDTGSDAVHNHAEAVHYAYKGYYPERHAAVDRDAAEVDAAITSLTALITKLEAREPVAWMGYRHGVCYLASSRYFAERDSELYTTPLYKD